MNTPGTTYVTGKMISATLDTGLTNAYRKIQEVWHNNQRYKRRKHSRVTIKEYAEHFGYELHEFVDQINKKCKMKIEYANTTTNKTTN